MKAALRTDIPAARRLLPVAALWTFLRRVSFVDFFNCDSGELGFVLDHPGKLAIGPLVQPLIHLAAIVNSITDAANIADGDRRDTSLKEHLHDLPAQFVKKIRDLVVDVAQLLVFRLDELFPTVRSTLFAIYLRIELRFQLVLVVAKGTKLPAVNREGVRAREDGSEVFFAKVDSSDFITTRSIFRLYSILSTNDKAAGTLPDLNDSRLRLHRPVDQDRILSAFRGQAENAVISKRDALALPTQNIVSLVAALRRIAFPIVVVPRPDSIIELIGDCLGSLRRQCLMSFTMPSLHRRLTEPVVLSVDSSPIPRADAIPQVRRGAGQPLKLLSALNVEFTGQIHTQTEKPSRLPAGGTGLRVGPTAGNSRGQSTQSHSDYGVPRPCLDAQTAAESVSGSLRSPGEKSPCMSHLKEGPLLLFSRSTQWCNPRSCPR